MWIRITSVVGCLSFAAQSIYVFLLVIQFNKLAHAKEVANYFWIMVLHYNIGFKRQAVEQRAWWQTEGRHRRHTFQPQDLGPSYKGLNVVASTFFQSLLSLSLETTLKMLLRRPLAATECVKIEWSGGCGVCIANLFGIVKRADAFSRLRPPLP